MAISVASFLGVSATLKYVVATEIISELSRETGQFIEHIMYISAELLIDYTCLW